MRIGYCPDFELLGSPDINCTVDVSVEWDKGTPYLVIDDVLVGKTSLLRNEDVLMAAIGARIADMAEDDARLLERAVELLEKEES